MSISLRSIREKMRETVPGMSISEDAVRTLRIYLERQVVELTQAAKIVHDGENAMRRQTGDRLRVILSARAMRKAIRDENEKRKRQEG